MSYILHVESGVKFEIDGKDVAAIQAEVKNAGLLIGNVTLRRMVEGILASANGFELIDSLSAEEQEETTQALDRAKEDEATAQALKVNEAEVATNTVVAEGQGSGEAAGEGSEDGVDSVEEGDAGEDANAAVVDSVNAALAEGDAPSDAKVNSLSSQLLKESAAGKTLTPMASIEERKRRHTKREDMVDAARASQYGSLLAAVEEGVTPGVFLSYVNPDMRWFQFPVTDLANPDNIHARTNTYLDLAPVVSGGWGFSLYVNGKSFTKRQKVKENDAKILVEAINAWLPQALAEAKAAA